MIQNEQLQLQTQNERETQIKSCAFTGHREINASFPTQQLLEEIENAVKNGVHTFYCGMAKGFDLLAGEAVVFFKRKYPNIKLVACVPCYGQEKSFSVEDKSRYSALIRNADETVVLSEYYYTGCMQKRDRYMADHADMMIAYCKKEEGGTAYTVKYFQKRYPHKPIIFL